MKISITKKSQGLSERLKIRILCTTIDYNEKYSEDIIINELVKVKFHFIHNTFSSRMTCLIGVRKIFKDCNVKAKVWTSTGYCSERICSDKICWEAIADAHNILATITPVDRTHVITYEFSVSMYVYKFENMANEKLYNDTELTDFSLSTAEGSVAVHKAQLAALSDVFRTMLSREWKETKEGRINMDGVTLQTLQQLKDYMYLGTLPDDDLLPLWSIASCYLIEDLKTQCLLKLSEIIKPENFYSMLQYSIENKMPELTFAIINETPEEVLRDAEKISKEKCVKEETENKE